MKKVLDTYSSYSYSLSYSSSYSSSSSSSYGVLDTLFKFLKYPINTLFEL